MADEENQGFVDRHPGWSALFLFALALSVSHLIIWITWGTADKDGATWIGRAGQFGDQFGVVNGFVSLLTIYFLVKTFRAQQKQIHEEKQVRINEKKEACVNEGLLTQLILSRQWNQVKQYYRNHIEPNRGLSPDQRAMKITPAVNYERMDMLNIKSLSFLINSESAGLVPNLMLCQDRYISFLNTNAFRVDRFSRVRHQVANQQRRIAIVGATPEDMMFADLVSGTNSLIDIGDTYLQQAEQLMNDLRTVLKNRYPGEKFLMLTVTEPRSDFGDNISDQGFPDISLQQQ